MKTALLRALVGEAIRAPSSHNTQPWLFELTGEDLRLYADRTRALPVNDPEDRELTISCGCALFGLRAAAAAAGHGLTVRPIPDPERQEDLLAAIRCDGAAETALAPLGSAIAARRTYRKRFGDADVTAESVSALKAAAATEGARLHVVERSEDREAVAALVAEGDRLLWANPSWRRELAAWMHPRRKGDGLTLPWLAVPAAQLVVRSFDMGGGIAAGDRDLAAGSPLLAVLGTPGDAPADWLAAGQALQRVLLTAVGAGLQASYLNQPIQVGTLRPRLAALCPAAGRPQILLRLGVPEEILPPSPRRPLDSVLEEIPAPRRSEGADS